MRNQMFQMRSQTSYCFLDLNSITTSPFAPTHGCVSGVFWAKISLSIARNVFEDPRKTEWPCAQTPDPIAGRFHGCFAVCECKLQWTHTSTHTHDLKSKGPMMTSMRWASLRSVFITKFITVPSLPSNKHPNETTNGKISRRSFTINVNQRLCRYQLTRQNKIDFAWCCCRSKFPVPLTFDLHPSPYLTPS